MFYRIGRRGKIVLQYLMVLQHRNITHFPMITVKYETPSQMLDNYNTMVHHRNISYRKMDGMEASCFVGLFLEC